MELSKGSVASLGAARHLGHNTLCLIVRSTPGGYYVRDCAGRSDGPTLAFKTQQRLVAKERIVRLASFPLVDEGDRSTRQQRRHMILRGFKRNASARKRADEAARLEHLLATQTGGLRTGAARMLEWPYNRRSKKSRGTE